MPAAWAEPVAHDVLALRGLRYNEMVIQIGYVTLWSVAFPLAPLCCFINNLFEVPVDARKILDAFQRPKPVNADGIGAWRQIIVFISYASVRDRQAQRNGGGRGGGSLCVLALLRHTEHIPKSARAHTSTNNQRRALSLEPRVALADFGDTEFGNTESA